MAHPSHTRLIGGFSVSPVIQTVMEGQSAILTINRTGRTTASASVRYDTRSGSAQQRVDFTATSGTATFKPGQSEVSITVPTLADGREERTEFFGLVLGQPSPGMGLGRNAAARIGITDPPPHCSGDVAAVAYDREGWEIYTCNQMPDGSIIASMDGPSRWLKFHADGTFDDYLPLNLPPEVRFEGLPDGSIVIQEENGVTKADPATGVVLAFLEIAEGAHPEPEGCFSDGSVLVNASTRLIRVSADFESTTPFPNTINASGITAVTDARVLPSGNVLAACATADDNWHLATYTDAGAVMEVKTLSIVGLDRGDFPSASWQSAAAGALTPDGSTQAARPLIRLNADGSVDASFQFRSQGNEELVAVAVDAQDRLLVTYAERSLALNYVLRRHTPDGAWDGEFATCLYGNARGDINLRLAVGGVIPLANGKIFAAGAFGAVNDTYYGYPGPLAVLLHGDSLRCRGYLEGPPTTLTAAENGGVAQLKLRRVRGSHGKLSFTLRALPDESALAGKDFLFPETRVTFRHGETEKTINIRILNDSQAQGNRTGFLAVLESPVTDFLDQLDGSPVFKIFDPSARIRDYRSIPGANPLPTAIAGYPLQIVDDKPSSSRCRQGMRFRFSIARGGGAGITALLTITIAIPTPPASRISAPTPLSNVQGKGTRTPRKKRLGSARHGHGKTDPACCVHAGGGMICPGGGSQGG